MITLPVRKNSRTEPRPSRPAAFIAASGLALALVWVFTATSAVAAPKGGKPTPTPNPSATPKPAPNAPGNFRVTAQTACTITVAWDPVNFTSADFNYHLSGTKQATPAILPKTATSHTFTGLAHGSEYWFFIYARDTSGKASGQSSVTTRTLLDTIPPSTAPVVSVTEIGSNYASLSWTPAEDGGCNLSYEVFVNGSLWSQTARSVTSIILRFLQPATTYSVTARAFDSRLQRGPFSNPVSVTTLPPNPNDHTPPTTPTNLGAHGFSDGSTEIQVQWTQSTDDFDAQANIRYDTYLNGVLDDIRFGSGGPITIYLESGENTIEVYATDTAGNTSPPATFTISP